MKDPAKEYKSKMKALVAEQKQVTEDVIKLTKKLQDIEAEIEKLEDEEFVRTGVFKWSESFEIKVTYKELLQDLVKKTEGNMISPNPMNEPNLN